MTKAYILYVHHKFYKISYIALIRLIISKKMFSSLSFQKDF